MHGYSCMRLSICRGFMYLEKHITADSEYHVIHSVLDDKIPFVEYFYCTVSALVCVYYCGIPLFFLYRCRGVL